MPPGVQHTLSAMFQRKDLGFLSVNLFLNLALNSASAHLRNSEYLMDELILIPLYLDRLTFQEKLELLEAAFAVSGSRP